jgi:hypothetical protein
MMILYVCPDSWKRVADEEKKVVASLVAAAIGCAKVVEGAADTAHEPCLELALDWMEVNPMVPRGTKCEALVKGLAKNHQGLQPSSLWVRLQIGVN